MELMLEIISRQKFSSEIKPSCVFSEAGGYIGRSAESDWVLPDRAKRVSRKHVLITCDGRAFYLEDLSSNGVLWVLTQELVGKSGRHKISHGDTYQIGDYILQARLLMSPTAYTQPEMDASANIIPDEAFLDLDPLTALDQEDELAAKRRLGFYDELLSPPKEAERSLSDHNEALLSVLSPIKSRPDELLPPAAKRGKGGPVSDPLASVEKAIVDVTQTISRLTGTLAVLEAAREGLKKGGASPPSAAIIPDDFNVNDLL